MRAKDKYLQTGKIVKTFGIKGELKVEPWCDSPYDFTEFPNIYIGGSAAKSKLEIEKARVAKNMVIIKLSSVNSVEDAAAYIGSILYLDREDLDIGDNFFISDLLGITIRDADNPEVSYGELIEVTSTGANNIYHVRGSDGKLRLVPAIDDVIISTDIENGIMKIRPLKGLFE
ncbi:MAG: ribosome maturation factor RimM [Oscillospiraceae bacterium]|nr:ribosome maturation factor RimM [Oscillospiraceae bacterium]